MSRIFRRPRMILYGIGRKYTYQKSIDLQRQNYSELAWIANLRELTLSYPFIDFFRDPLASMDIHQDACLAMTMDSGPDLLKDLKELWRVDLRSMEVD
ncbi:hypothetical protein BGW39_010661 [Mortierella sp. 14UC]|nr:hypothetical protein BGW39_010661 [Mortierella sp. 14UC]